MTGFGTVDLEIPDRRPPPPSPSPVGGVVQRIAALEDRLQRHVERSKFLEGEMARIVESLSMLQDTDNRIVEILVELMPRLGFAPLTDAPPAGTMI